MSAEPLLSPVKLPFDENLSPSLARSLGDLFPDSTHVHDCQLGSASDDEIWRYAISHGLAIVSKDFDFYEKSVLLGGPPKLIWLRTGNSSTAHVERLFRAYFQQIQAFASASSESLLVIP